MPTSSSRSFDQMAKIRELEERLMVRADVFSSSSRERLAKGIGQLKDIAYFLEDSADRGFTHPGRLEEELPILVERLLAVVDGPRSSALLSVTTQIDSFYTYFEKVSNSANQSLIDETNALREQVRQYELKEQNQKTKERVVKDIKSAEGAKDWAAFYESYVKPNSADDVKRSWWGRFSYSGDNLFQLERKWELQRSFWLACLTVLFLAYILWIILFVPAASRDFQEVVVEKLIFLPLVLILSISFAFASRNYRIYANMLADYRHRQIVARILQNVILGNVFGEKDELKMELLREGAKAMFTLRTAGHLGKDSFEKISIAEIIKELKSTTIVK